MLRGRTQVLNLVPWGGVEVDLRHLRFAGLHGWDALAQAAMQSYIQDITANQARRARWRSTMRICRAEMCCVLT